MEWRARPRDVRQSAANDMATSDVHRRWRGLRGQTECCAERCFLSGALTLASEANQRVRISHARPHLLSVHTRQQLHLFPRRISKLCVLHLA
jgi:hypothetical protein